MVHMMHHVVADMMMINMHMAGLSFCGNSLGAIRICFRTRRRRISLGG